MGYLVDGGSHIDVPLSNLAVMAFNDGGDFVGSRLFPPVPVDKQSNGYYIVDPDSWLRVARTERSPLATANGIDWNVSTSTYFCNNHALQTLTAKETLSNADRAIRIRENNTRFLTTAHLRAMELRISNTVTSITNVGSGVTLTGGNQFSDYVNSDPISTVNTAVAFIENRTGFSPNTGVMDKDTARMLRHHPAIREYMKYTNDGPVPLPMLAEVFGLDRIWIAKGIYNSAKEGATAVRTNIFGKNFLIARVEDSPVDLQVATFGLGIQWHPEGFPAAFAIERYDHHDKSKKAEVQESQYFQDERIIAPDLSYLIAASVA